MQLLFKNISSTKTGKDCYFYIHGVPMPNEMAPLYSKILTEPKVIINLKFNLRSLLHAHFFRDGRL